MARKDLYHEHVRQALANDGWTITHDPYFLTLKGKDGKKHNYPIDLGAGRLIGANRAEEKIAVEVKSFIGSSFIDDFHKALGQYFDYQVGLSIQEPDRLLYIAITANAYRKLDKSPLAALAAQHYQLKFIIFDEKSKTIEQWKI